MSEKNTPKSEENSLIIPDLTKVDDKQPLLLKPGTYTVKALSVKRSVSRKKELFHNYKLEVMAGPESGKIAFTKLSTLKTALWIYRRFVKACGKTPEGATDCRTLLGSALSIQCRLDRFRGKEVLNITKFLPL